MNVIVLSIVLYALVPDCVFGYCTTPSSVTRASLFEGNSFESVNAVVDPSAVNSSTVLSARSKLAATSPMNEPNTTSDDSGAVLYTIVESASIPYPTVGLVVSCGC